MDNEKVLKKLIKKIIEVITSLEDAKIELERARFMSEKLYEMYSDTNKSDEVKVYEWECCGKIVDIEFNFSEIINMIETRRQNAKISKRRA